MVSPLNGVRVLDLSYQGPGPYCTMMLADYGASVIVVQEPGLERALEQDRGGRRGESMPWDDTRFNAYHPHFRNKMRMTLNLKDDQARQILYKLVQKSDVFVEGFRPGVTRRLRVDYKTLKRVNPKIIYCSISGYGQTGPYSNLPGHDINYIGMAGVLGLIGETNRPPVIPLNLIADYGGGGMHAAFAILAALLIREKAGLGQYIDVSVLDTVLSLAARQIASFLENGTVPGRGTHLLNGGFPQYNIYKTRDGKFLTIGCLEPWFFAKLCKVLGREDLIPFYKNMRERRKEILKVFRNIFRTKTRDEWFDFLRDKDVCVGKVYDLDEVVKDQQILKRGMIVELSDHAIGQLKLVGLPIKFSKTPGVIKKAGYVRGKNTKEILLDLGYSRNDINEMKLKGII